MANTKISSLPDGVTAQDTDQFPLAYSGLNYSLLTTEILVETDGLYSGGYELFVDAAGQTAQVQIRSQFSTGPLYSGVLMYADESSPECEATCDVSTGDGTRAFVDLDNSGNSDVLIQLFVQTVNPGNFQSFIHVSNGSIQTRVVDGVGTSYINLTANGTYSILVSASDGTNTSTFTVKPTYTSFDILNTPAIFFASLPTSPATGMLQTVHDSSTATWGATIAGGGANKVLAFYNGTNWTVAGK